jgi:diketogulonate reductase-like aldo/keto reductase
VLAQDGVIAIPKAGRPKHVEANAQALDLVLAPEELAAIDRSFPAPTAKEPLAML